MCRDWHFYLVFALDIEAAASEASESQAETAAFVRVLLSEEVF